MQVYSQLNVQREAYPASDRALVVICTAVGRVKQRTHEQNEGAAKVS